MDRQKLIEEIKGLQKNQSKFSLEDIDCLWYFRIILFFV